MVVDVDVVLATGEVRVKRIVTAQDSGPISNPDGLRNQVEGGALHGMSRALMEEVTWDQQKVTSVDWRTYRTMSLGAQVPVLETVLINNVDELPAAPVKVPSRWLPRRSATRSSTPLAPASARCRSRRRA